MKAFVHFQPDAESDNFEGARLRKSIKSALEVLGIPYTNSLMDDFDVAHFIYLEDESVIQELKERNVPIIVSALYCEDDPCASYIEYKNKDGERIYTVKPKTIKFLESVDLILVPNQPAKDMLAAAGITTRVEICPVGVNFARFDFSRDDEKELFYRYFNCEQDKKIALAIGDCSDEIDGLGVIAKAAQICKDVNFYYLVKNEHGNKLGWKNRRAIKKLKVPHNVVFANLVPDDIYRSALLNADVYLHPGYKPAGLISIYEAMVAKCQLIVRQQDILEGLAVDQETAYVASYSETLAGIIKDYFDGKLKPTINNAYKRVSKNDIKAFGKKIVEFYQEVIKK